MSDWWFLESLRKEKELKEYKRREQEREEEYEEELRKAREKQYNIYYICPIKSAHEYVENDCITFWDDSETEFHISYDKLAEETDENGRDIYIADMEIYFTLGEIIDRQELYGINLKKAREIYDTLGTTVEFSFDDFLSFLRVELREFSSDIFM